MSQSIPVSAAIRNSDVHVTCARIQVKGVLTPGVPPPKCAVYRRETQSIINSCPTSQRPLTVSTSMMMVPYNIVYFLDGSRYNSSLCAPSSLCEGGAGRESFLPWFLNAPILIPTGKGFALFWREFSDYIGPQLSSARENLEKLNSLAMHRRARTHISCNIREVTYESVHILFYSFKI